MSDDPKNPLHAPPEGTPELLQKDLSLDRRNRRIPTFEELRVAEAPTEPARPQTTRPPAARPPAPAARPAAQGTVPATPRLSQPPMAAQRSPGPSEPTGLLPPHQPRPQPPSPSEWAQQQRPGGPTGPVITAAQTGQGGAQPQNRAPPRQLAPLPQRPGSQVPPGLAPRSQPTPAPIAARPAPLPQPPPARPAQPMVSAGYRAIPGALPAHMLVTQPGMSSPFKNNPDLTLDPEPEASPPQRASAPEAPPPASASAPATAPARVPRQLGARPAAKPDDRIFASPAGLFRRVMAWLVDMLVIGSVAGVFLLGATLAIAPKGAHLAHSMLSIALPAALLAAILAFVYTTLFAFLFRGRTPGRRLLGIHLVDGTGAAPAPGRALIRAALSLVSFGLFLSGFWLALFDRRGQTLHDKLTRTFVVRLQA